ncbi:uncharacterized protein LOC133180207 [Saccostrea echinata]|uniref:uncharacterized protein LOC133180207 n=1 Tax=Saccostrea echinata TaxID=191078 RepID=UPI002A81DB41|nr:uncharacterized protein LOC133180207 [Saccostrea echinata]
MSNFVGYRVIMVFQMFTIGKLKGSKPKPYSNPLKVKVCGVGTRSSYTTSAGQKKESVVIGVADRDSVVKVILYDIDKLPSLKVSDTVMLTNYVFKLDPEPVVVLTKVSKIMRTSSLDVPQNIIDEAKMISHPPPAETISVKAAKISPVKTLISVKGRVTSEELVRTVQVKGQDVAVQNIKIKDDTDEVKVSLWREMTATCSVGSFLQITNVVVNHFQEEISLSTTSKTQIQKCEAPPSILVGSVIAYEKNELGFSLMIEEGENFQHLDIPLNVVTKALQCEQNAAETTLSGKIPFKCRIKTLNGNVEDFSTA